jgi:hypothetical protein
VRAEKYVTSLFIRNFGNKSKYSQWDFDLSSIVEEKERFLFLDEFSF